MMRRISREYGITLIELLMVIAIIGMIVVAIGLQTRAAGDVWKTGDRHLEVMQNALIGMDKMTRELRQAKSIIAISGSNIDFHGWNDSPRSFQLTTRSGRQYLSTENGELSGPVQSLVFTYYREDGATQATEPYEVRLIDIQLTTSDSKETVNNIPLSSRVYVRNDSIYPITDFAIFGGGGVTLLNNVTVLGDVGSNGDIELKNGSEVGDIVNAGTLILQNPEQIEYGSKYRGYVKLPAATPFPEDRTLVTIDSFEGGSLSPNNTGERYGSLSLGNNKSLTLSSGDYYFDSISIGNKLSLSINLTGGSGKLRIFVKGDVVFGNILDSTVNSLDVLGGGAADIYAESHGSWYMGNSSQWFGTIFVPNGDVDLVDGYIKGAIYCAGTIEIHNTSTLEFVLCSNLPPQFSIQ